MVCWLLLRCDLNKFHWKLLKIAVSRLLSLFLAHTGCLVNYGAALRCICFSCTSAIGRPCRYRSQHRSVVFKTSSSRYSYLNEWGVSACSEARLHGLAVFYSACVSSMLVMLLETQLCWNNNQDLTLLASHQLWCACVCIHASALSFSQSFLKSLTVSLIPPLSVTDDR